MKAAGAAQGARTEPRQQDGAVSAPQARAQEVRGRAGGERAQARVRAERRQLGAVCLCRRHGPVLGWAHNLMVRDMVMWLKIYILK